MKRILGMVMCILAVMLFVVPVNAEDGLSVEETVQRLEESGYHFVTEKDLDASIDNMTGLGVYTVFTVAEIEDNCVKAEGIEDDYSFLVFYTEKDYTKNVEENDIVAVFGIVDEPKSFLGMNITSVKQCRIFALGDDAKKYDKGETDAVLAEYVLSDEEAAIENGDLSEEDFKASCQYFDYNDILRNPDSYKKVNAVVSGTVDQKIDGLFDLYTTLYIVDGNGNKWACNIVYEEGQSRILEGDYVTVYGVLDGTEKAETILGKQVIMPYISIEYVG